MCDMEVDIAEEASGGWRYSHLEKCLENLVRSYKPGSFKKLARAFPEFAEKYPEALKLISDSFGDKHTEDLQNSVKELLKTSDIERKLQELEKITENEDFQWRPSGDAERDMRAHVALCKQSEIQHLDQQLIEEEEELKELRETLAQKEKDFKQKLLHMNSVAEEVATAARFCFSNEDNIFKLLKQADSEIA